MMIKLEAESGEAQIAGSLMDRVLMGMISRLGAHCFLALSFRILVSPLILNIQV